MTKQHIEDIRLVPETTQKLLNQRQQVDYRDHREQLIKWLLHIGKNPETADGYSSSTIEKDAYRLDKFYRWVWTEHTGDGYTTNITQDHADAYVDHLAFSDGSNTHKANCVKALKKLFKWKHHERGGDTWESEKSFSYQPSKPQNYLTRRERTLILLVNVSAADDEGVAEVLESFDGMNSSFQTNQGEFYWTNHTGLEAGEYTFSGWARDVDGGWSSTGERSVTVEENEPVDINILDPNNLTYLSGEFRLRF